MEFLLTTLAIVTPPGTGAIDTLARPFRRGEANLVAASGCTLGILPHLIAAFSGLAALLHASASAFQILKMARRRLSAPYGLGHVPRAQRYRRRSDRYALALPSYARNHRPNPTSGQNAAHSFIRHGGGAGAPDRMKLGTLMSLLFLLDQHSFQFFNRRFQNVKSGSIGSKRLISVGRGVLNQPARQSATVRIPLVRLQQVVRIPGLERSPINLSHFNLYHIRRP